MRRFRSPGTECSVTSSTLSMSLKSTNASACSRGHRSHVLEAMGLEAKVIDGAIRISFGRENTLSDVDELRAGLLEAVARL